VEENKTRGRPNTPPEQKIGDNGLTVQQWARIQQEARAKGLTAAQLLRMAVTWYFTVIDQERANILSIPHEQKQELDKQYEQLAFPFYTKPASDFDNPESRKTFKQGDLNNG